MVEKYNPDIHTLDFNFDYLPQETQNLRQVFSHPHEIRREDIWQVALWKYSRVIGIEENDPVLDDIVAVANDSSIKLMDDQSMSLVSNLVSKDGIGYPLASAILKFTRDDIYPIVDVRAYRALYGQKIQSSQYTLDIYLEYANDLMAISKNLKRPLREIDEQLYCFDKKLNGKI